MSNPVLKYHLSGYLAGVMNFIVPFIAIPIVSYKLNNWWLLIGIISLFLGEIISASPKIKWTIVIGAILFCIFNWVENGFDIKNLMTFYLVCFLFGFFCHRLYNLIVFSDRATRAILAATGNKQADAAIQKEVAEGVKKYLHDNLKDENSN